MEEGQERVQASYPGQLRAAGRDQGQVRSGEPLPGQSESSSSRHDSLTSSGAFEDDVRPSQQERDKRHEASHDHRRRRCTAPLGRDGHPGGRPILFIHGFSQCWLAWSRQLNSDLADGYRLVAMDLRGHGLSEKPRDGYSDSRLWADDIDAVIRTLNLDHPVLCGWSYGLVVLD